MKSVLHIINIQIQDKKCKIPAIKNTLLNYLTASSYNYTRYTAAHKPTRILTPNVSSAKTGFQ